MGAHAASSFVAQCCANEISSQGVDACAVGQDVGGILRFVAVSFMLGDVRWHQTVFLILEHYLYLNTGFDLAA